MYWRECDDQILAFRTRFACAPNVIEVQEGTACFADNPIGLGSVASAAWPSELRYRGLLVRVIPRSADRAAVTVMREEAMSYL